MQLTSLNGIERRHRHIFLSPHFDDIVYSCGGTLGVQVSSGLRPLIITVFGGIPDQKAALSETALRIHRHMGFADNLGPGAAIEARRKEDASACGYMETDYLWLDYLDASYRGNPPTYPTEESFMGGEVQPVDQWIDQKLAEDLLALQTQLPDAAWYAPLGIGRHVDHQIVCSAAYRLVQQGARVYFYEDFPYIVRHKGSLEARLKELGSNLEPTLVEVSEFMPARLAAADMYETQIGQNFASKEAMHSTMDEYTHSIRPIETVQLERYWTTR